MDILYRISEALKDKDSEDGVRVSYTDRNYKNVVKIFKTDPQGSPDNAMTAAKAWVKKLEAKDAKDPYGNIRGKVRIEYMSEER